MFARHDYLNKVREQQQAAAADHGRAEELQTAAIERFRASALPLLQIAPNCKLTHIGGALLRAALFIDEPAVSWRNTPTSFAIMITDGLENARRGPIAFTSHAELLIVNGSASHGALTQLHPQRFESVDAAINFAMKLLNPETNHETHHGPTSY